MTVHTWSCCWWTCWSQTTHRCGDCRRSHWSCTCPAKRKIVEHIRCCTYISISVREHLRVGCCVILLCYLSVVPIDLQHKELVNIKIRWFSPYSIAYRLSRFCGNVESDNLVGFCHISCTVCQAWEEGEIGRKRVNLKYHSVSIELSKHQLKWWFGPWLSAFDSQAAMVRDTWAVPGIDSMFLLGDGGC